MSNYTKTTNFATKDALASGNAAKIVKGTEIDTEFNNIATASATKANAANAALTGTTTAVTVNISGTLTADHNYWRSILMMVRGPNGNMYNPNELPSNLRMAKPDRAGMPLTEPESRSFFQSRFCR